MEHENEKLDTMFRRLSSDDLRESPSFDFTEKVMAEVNAIDSSSIFVYKPLISLQSWLIIACVFLFFMTYGFLTGSTVENQWFSTMDLSTYQWDIFQKPNFEFSKTLTYGLLLFAVMLGVQVTMLKSFFNQRLSSV